MAKRNWVDGVLGNTPLTAKRLNDLENDLESALLQLARDPSQLFTGTVTNDQNGAPTSALVTWPDGSVGTYAGTSSTAFPGAVDAYTVTKVGSPSLTFAQPAVTRDSNGNITNRPAITVN